MNIQDFLGIGIVGIALSIFMEGVKAKFNPSKGMTKLITLGLAVVLGTVYYFGVQTVWWQSVIGVLSAATVVWAFIINNEK